MRMERPLLVILLMTIALTAHAALYKAKVRCDFDSALAAGSYDDVHAAFTAKNAPKNSCKEGQKVGIVLFQFEKEWTSTEDILKAMRKGGCHPANWQELLAFGAAWPKFQKNGPIVGLGTRWPVAGGMSYPTLSSSGRDQRSVNLPIDMGAWHRSRAFAAVCK